MSTPPGEYKRNGRQGGPGESTAVPRWCSPEMFLPAAPGARLDLSHCTFRRRPRTVVLGRLAVSHLPLFQPSSFSPRLFVSRVSRPSGRLPRPKLDYITAPHANRSLRSMVYSILRTGGKFQSITACSSGVMGAACPGVVGKRELWRASEWAIEFASPLNDDVR